MSSSSSVVQPVIPPHKIQWTPALHDTARNLFKYNPDFLRFLEGKDLFPNKTAEAPKLRLNCVEYFLVLSMHLHLQDCHHHDFTDPHGNPVAHDLAAFAINHNIHQCPIAAALVQYRDHADPFWPVWSHYQLVGLARTVNIHWDTDSAPTPHSSFDTFATWGTAHLLHDFQASDLLLFVQPRPDKGCGICVHAVMVTKVEKYVKDLEVASFEGVATKDKVKSGASHEARSVLFPSTPLHKVLGRLAHHTAPVTLCVISLGHEHYRYRCQNAQVPSQHHS